MLGLSTIASLLIRVDYFAVEIANDTTLHFATQLEDILSKQSVNIDRLLFTIIGRQPVSRHLTSFLNPSQCIALHVNLKNLH